jgi:hypothetical protein
VRDEVLQYEGIVFDFHYSKKKKSIVSVWLTIE